MLIYKYNDPGGLFVSITDSTSGEGSVRLTSSVDLSGVSVLPFRTTEELAAEAHREAEVLYESIKDGLKVVVDSVCYDVRDRFDFDYQKRGGTGARVRKNKGSVVSVSASLANSIEAEAVARLTDLADAFNADLLAIEAGDFSLPNLKIEESKNAPEEDLLAEKS